MRLWPLVALLLTVLLWLGIWPRRLSHAEPPRDLCERCAPATVRAATEERAFFIGRTRVEAMKSASELAYRVASERVVRTVEKKRLQCPAEGCVPGPEEVTSGIEESLPCRHGRLSKKPRNRQLAKKRLAKWREACVATLGDAEKCDDVAVQRAKPEWAECSVGVWAKKTRRCAPRRCGASRGR